MSIIHRAWCDPTECYARSDETIAHVSTPVGLIPLHGQVDVALVERGDGIEVKLSAHGSVTTTAMTLHPELAAELGKALLDHAERALALSAPSGFGGAHALRCLPLRNLSLAPSPECSTSG